jgi:hypothetical protein
VGVTEPVHLAREQAKVYGFNFACLRPSREVGARVDCLDPGLLQENSRDNNKNSNYF